MTTFDGIATLTGWQWLFLLEAAPAIILGVAVIIWLDNTPSTAQWLSSEERTWLVEQLRHETKQKALSGHIDGFAKVLTHSKVWWLVKWRLFFRYYGLVWYFFLVTANY
jgi:MFS transporter, ACS family, tartrate transporter